MRHVTVRNRCLFVHRGVGVCPIACWDTHPHKVDTPPANPPAPETATAAYGTHPTTMHCSLNLWCLRSMNTILCKPFISVSVSVSVSGSVNIPLGRTPWCHSKNYHVANAQFLGGEFKCWRIFCWCMTALFRLGCTFRLTGVKFCLHQVILVLTCESRFFRFCRIKIIGCMCACVVQACVRVCPGKGVSGHFLMNKVNVYCIFFY